MTGNGLGPWWFPDKTRRALTNWASARFPSLSWEKHDASYIAGHPERWICDRGFLRAMLGDTLQKQGVAQIWALGLAAWLFWVAVRCFGWASYNRSAK